MRVYSAIYLVLVLFTLQAVEGAYDYCRSYGNQVLEEFLTKPPMKGCKGTDEDPGIPDASLGDPSNCSDVVVLLKDHSIPVPTQKSITKVIAWKLADMNLDGSSKYLISMAFVKFYANRNWEVYSLEQESLASARCKTLRQEIKIGGDQFDRIIADCSADQPHERGQYVYMKLSLMRFLQDAGFWMNDINNFSRWNAYVGLSRLCHPKIVHEIMTWTTRDLIGEWSALFCNAASCEILNTLSTMDLNSAASPTFVETGNITETEKHLQFFNGLKIPHGEHNNEKFEIANCIFAEAMWRVFSKKDTYLEAIKRVLADDKANSDPVFLHLAFGRRPSKDHIQRNVGGALWRIIMHEYDEIKTALKRSRVEQPWRKKMLLPANGEYCTVLNTLEESDTWHNAIQAYREIT